MDILENESTVKDGNTGIENSDELKKISPIQEKSLKNDINENESVENGLNGNKPVENGLNGSKSIETNGHLSDNKAEESKTDKQEFVEEKLEQINLTDSKDSKDDESKNNILQSKSSEFTYTTFEADRSDSSDESQPPAIGEPEQLPTVDEKDQKFETEINGSSEASLQQSSSKVNDDEATKRLEVDEFIKKVKQNQISNKDACTYMLNLLVSGEFDLEKNFIIQNIKSIMSLIQVIKCAQPSLKAELWSLFTAILRKSQLNLQACVEIGLIETALHELKDSDTVCAELIVDMLTVLASYSVTVEELKAIFNQLKATDKIWPKNSVKLLNVLKSMPHRYGPDEFFCLPGRKASNKKTGISLPPIRNWPYQNGFTFSTWFRIDPVSGANVEIEKPYLYSFGTSKGSGYQAYFMGSCLVLNYKTKPNGKEQQHCIQFEFKPREWYMITICHIYNRWSKSQIICYVNGVQLSFVQMPFYIDQTEIFDKCFLGCTPDASNELNLFSGQLSTIYLFNQTLDSATTAALFKLGPSYKNQFRYENESAHLNLNAETRKLIYDGKLTQAIAFMYNPINCDSQLLLQSAPKQNFPQYFVHNAHALLLNDVKAVKTASIYSILLSIGGIQVFYVLFNQLDFKQVDDSIDYTVAETLMKLLCDMIEISYNVQIQMINSKGLLAISYALEKSSRKHISMYFLDSIIKLTKFLVQLPNPNGTILLKQLLDHILFNPSIWIYCSIEVQTKLYTYLATEFVNDLNIYVNIRRISAVIQTIHALKYYYWIVDPRTRSGYEPKTEEALRPDRNTIIKIRSYMLLYLKELVTKEAGVQQDELQAMLNYLHTVHENENLIDVLKLVVTLMHEHPPSMIPAFDHKLGIRTIMKLLGSDNETIRLQTLKLLGFFLQKSTLKRKSDNMNTHNLFTLISDKLLMSNNEFSMGLYNTLYEILVEKTVNQVLDTPHQPPDSTHHIENPLIIKVITMVLRNKNTKSKKSFVIKKQLLSDLIALSTDSRENRRTLLQMSVWQEFLIGLAYVYPENSEESEVTDLVYDLFRILLQHAIKHEYGGWRVWIDTLSILHSRVSKEEYHLKMTKLEDYEKNKKVAGYMDENAVKSESGTEVLENGKADEQGSDQRMPYQPPPFRIPEFKWSHLHKRLLSDMLDSIEIEINEWKKLDGGSVNTLLDCANSPDNVIFSVNTIHIVSQLADILTNACGGLLPLLASATTVNTTEIEILENTEGMNSKEGYEFLERIILISDVIILGCNTSFGDLEQEKNLPNGAIVRQALRLTFTYAVRSCLEFRRHNNQFETSIPVMDSTNNLKALSAKDPIEALLETQLNNSEAKKDIRKDCLLQNVDLFRLRALVYRDVVRNDRNKAKPFVIVDDVKQSQYVSLATVYFISVLMVSRYRDIIESNSNGIQSSDTSSNSHSDVASNDTIKKQGTSSSDSVSLNENTNQNGNSHETNGHEDSKLTGFSEIKLSEQQQQQQEDEKNTPVNTISSIQVNTMPTAAPSSTVIDKLPEYPKSDQDLSSIIRSDNMSITDKLEKALISIAPFLKDILVEFSQLLSKIIVGSHGQELISTGISALRQSSSVIELVMLLCSQEWQTSLQKHAGLSFIELVNEGRLLSHASKDHIVRVANEADFILNRMRADDVKKHAEFEQACNQTSIERKEEEVICEHLITAARKRDHYFAVKLRDKILNLITDKQGCWFNSSSNYQIYWKLDSWEDDMRRRRRFVKNPNGTSHLEATLKASLEHNTDAFNINKEELMKLNSQRINSDFASNLNGQQEQLHINEAELEQELTGPIHYTTKCKLVCSVCVVNGTLSVTSNELYFEVDENDSTYKNIDTNLLNYAENFHGKWHFNEIRSVFSRRYLLQNIGLEIFVANRSSVMFAFTDRRTVEKVVNILPRVGVGPRYGLPQARHTSLASPQQLFRSSNMTQKWQRREISNFEYLMYLNTIAGRTYNDLNQYLIFPWILINYDSPTIDLNSPSSYRDLSKPIGALNPSRRQTFIDRYQNWDHTNIPAFHYGTHYSTAAFALNWLIRIEPFTSYFLNLQDRKFDHADRTFHSVSTSWKNCQRDTSDVKELIPEFFYLPEMFMNLNKYNMGLTQDNNVVDDVELPKWAKNAHDFVRINRMALESEFVSCQIHQWIDLIFGYKQRGPEAIRNCNVFYYLTYEGAVNLESIEDQVTKEAIESQIKNFGQTPCQLLTEPHPPRSSAISMSPMMFAQHSEDVCMIMKFLSNSPIIFVSANTSQPSFNSTNSSTGQFYPSVITISSKHEFSINKYNSSASSVTQSSAINNYNAFTEAASSPGQQNSQASQSSTSGSASITSQNLSNNAISANNTPSAIQQTLPIVMDQLLAFNTALHKRQLGENFDDKLKFNQNNFIVTYDNKYIFATGFFDKSFRIFQADSAKLVQIVFGHYDLVTCVNRSEMTQNGNCFIATGSRDSTIMIWIWNGSKGLIVNKDLSIASKNENPSPGAILTGHIREIVGVVVSSELGLVISASQNGPVLVHTVYGDLLRQFEPMNDLLEDPTQLFMLQDAESVCVIYKTNHIAFFTINGKHLNDVQVENDTILALTMNQDGQFVVIGGENGTVYIYRTFDLSLAYTFPSCDASIRSLAITNDQKYIVVGLSTGCLIVFNVNFNVINQRKKTVTN